MIETHEERIRNVYQKNNTTQAILITKFSADIVIREEMDELNINLFG